MRESVNAVRDQWKGLDVFRWAEVGTLWLRVAVGTVTIVRIIRFVVGN
jgi:hypothetical protein